MTNQPSAISLGDALSHSTVLASLHMRIAQSQARLKAISPLLPASLAAQLKPASWDDGCWCLLAPHSAAASKLKQLLPKLLTHLNANDLPTREIRIKITT